MFYRSVVVDSYTTSKIFLSGKCSTTMFSSEVEVHSNYPTVELHIFLSALWAFCKLFRGTMS